MEVERIVSFTKETVPIDGDRKLYSYTFNLQPVAEPEAEETAGDGSVGDSSE
jgi:hypothetical protein